MSENISSLHCILCDMNYPLTEVRYHCDCGGLLEVIHDLEKLKARHPNLRELFSKRFRSLKKPYDSGVWRYHEMILPDLPVESIVSAPEGNTNLYRSKQLSNAFDTKRLYIKHEGENPTLSFKDRGMTAGVSWAHHMGMKIVACASTGDTSAAMAAYAAMAENMRGVVFLPHNKVSSEQLAQAISYGALTLVLETDFDGCMRLVRQVCESHPIYLLNSMNSFRIEGQKAIAIEAIQQLDWKVPDWIVIPVGNAGNISALGKGLREAFALGVIDRLPRIAGVQARRANPFYQSYRSDFVQKVVMTAKPTVASAIQIGAPVSHDKARREIAKFDGVVEEATESELMAAKAIADRCGVAVCPNSGVALAGLRKLRNKGIILDGESAVVIATAHGAKFSHVGVDYHLGMLPDLIPENTNPPRVIPAELGAIEDVIKPLL